MSFSASVYYTEPNVYVELSNIAPVSVPVGAFVPAAVGLGSKTRQTTETVTHTGSMSQDAFGVAVAPVVQVKSINGSDGTVYTQGQDFALLRSGAYPYTTKIDWTLLGSMTSSVAGPYNLTGLFLYIRVNGTLYSITLTGAAVTAAGLATIINTAVGSTVAAAGGAGNAYLVLSAKNIEIAQGAANANAVVGFVNGQSAVALEPGIGTTYSVVYTYVKPTSAYQSALIFSRIQDVYSEWGTPVAPQQLFAQTAPATVGGTANTLTDSAAPWASTDDLTGKYVFINGGDGQGQWRVILYNNATTLFIGEPFTTAPTTNCTYQIMAGPPTSISLGLQFTALNGATFFIGSQSEDDIFDSNNFRQALDNLEASVGGTDPYVILYMKGLHSTDTAILAAIKNHVITQSSLLVGKRRIAIIGSVANVTSPQSFIALAGALQNAPNTVGEGRFVVVGPADEQYTLPGGQVQLDGSYAAAALAGIVVNPLFDYAEPISGKTVNGFDSIDDTWLRKEKNLIAGSGVTLLELQSGSIVVRHALTTDMNSALSQELKVTRIKDGLANVLSVNLRKGFINVRSTGTVLDKAIKNTCQSILQNFVDQEIIQTFRNLDVHTPTNFPRQKNITFEFVPVWDNNYILLSFGAALQ